MKNKIEKYINNIRCDTICNYTSNYEDKEVFSFSGDGKGDFEERSEDTTKECLKNYIDFCKDQITLAEKYLKRIKV